MIFFRACIATARTETVSVWTQLSFSSGSEDPSHWLEVRASAVGGVAISRVAAAGGGGEQTFDCSGSGTRRSSDGQMVTSIMLGGNAMDSETVHGIDEHASSEHAFAVGAFAL